LCNELEELRFKGRGRKELDMSQKTDRTLVWLSGQLGEDVIATDQMVCGLVRNDEEGWIFSKGKQGKTMPGSKQEDVCELMSVFKRISLV
jgi:hypothetical protein